MGEKHIDFAKLYKTDVSQHIERKGRFSYLSWPYAVAELRKNCPNGTWEAKHFGDNHQPYCQTDSGNFVEVTVWPDIDMPNLKFTQIHPILDNKNKTIENPNAFQVNTSIMRCLVKAIALATGIGLHIYAGEDLPDEPPKVTHPKTDMGDDVALEKPTANPLWEQLAKEMPKRSLDELNEWYPENKNRIENMLNGKDLVKFMGSYRRLKAELEPK